jgi:hypothetical protein
LPQRFLDSGVSPYWRLLPRIPFLACGVLLGASLWYVARRLCGNTGGYIALTLYCFSPSMIQSSAVWNSEPEIVAAWGTFGTIFTGIAVAHTLYAPREVVLWNWRRMVLLGTAIALSVGSQFSMVIVIPVALAFMLYLAPVRRAAAFTIWLVACAVALGLIFAAYFFHPYIFLEAIRHASFFDGTWRNFTLLLVYRHATVQILRACPALALLLPVTFATFLVWPRTRYFGNVTPLLVAVLLLALGMVNSQISGAGFLFAAVPFLLIFVSGVIADLLETSFRPVVAACLCGLLLAYVILSVAAMVHVTRS